MTDQLYCPKCGPDWHGAYDMHHRCVECGEALKAEKVMERLKAVQEERDALLAHVERLIAIACIESAGPQLRQAIDDGPATSLERQQAEWAAEGARAAAEAIRYDYEGPIHADDIADFVDEVASDYRLQAEEES